MKIPVSFEEVEAIRRRLDEINAVPFTDIVWTRGGEALTVTPEEAEEWKFCGLTNASFVEFYDAEVIHDITITP